jgi:hypothetical protein
MISRKDYMDKKATYREYYGQFVNETIKNLVLGRFGIKRLRKAFKEDEHLNSIPLYSWDSMVYTLRSPEMIKAIKETGDFFSLAGGVCILKEAARQVIEDFIT